jgi:hypothetical protein
VELVIVADNNTRRSLMASFELDRKLSSTLFIIFINDLLSITVNPLSYCCLISRKSDAPSFDLRIQFQGEDGQRSQYLNILGTFIIPKLTWDKHVFNKAKNAAKFQGYQSRCKYSFSSMDLLKVYKAFI